MAYPYDQTQAENLIDGLLATNGISHAGLLNAVRAIPREDFVPEKFMRSAYVDKEIPFANGRTLMDPLVQLKLLQALDPQPHEKILIIGGATGYTAALLSTIVEQVEMVEEEPDLIEAAKSALAFINISNVHIVSGALTKGAPANGPYDAILIEGAVQQIPHAISSQLKEGGRLLTIHNIQQRPGTLSGLGEARIYEKTNNMLSARNLFDAGVSLLPGFAAPKGFTFN